MKYWIVSLTYILSFAFAQAEEPVPMQYSPAEIIALVNKWVSETGQIDPAEPALEGRSDQQQSVGTVENGRKKIIYPKQYESGFSLHVPGVSTALDEDILIDLALAYHSLLSTQMPRENFVAQFVKQLGINEDRFVMGLNKLKFRLKETEAAEIDIPKFYNVFQNPEWRPIQPGKRRGMPSDANISSIESDFDLESMKLESLHIEPEERDVQVVDIFYGTNRKGKLSRTGIAEYSGERSEELKMGSLKVSIPKSHKPGKVERPWLKIFENDSKHFVLLGTHELSRSEFDSQVKNKANQSEKTAMIFVHGFNVTFENAAFSVAQMAHDMDFPGVPFLFSWPSNGKVLDYVSDTNSARSSAEYLAEFIQRIDQLKTFDRVNIVAHSMGNLATITALRDHLSQAELSGGIHSLVMAAPDVDVKEFKTAMKLFPKIGSTTIYASDGDKALKVSQSLNGFDRLGLIGDHGIATFKNGIDSIDASLVGGIDLLKHSVHSAGKVLKDISKIFEGLSAEERCLLKKETQSQVSWQLRQKTNLCLIAAET